MRKKILTLVAAAAMTMAMSVTAFAAGWMQNDTGWWWDNGNGTWASNNWYWLDGNNDGIQECYYFGMDGYMYADTTTPDGYTVNADGAWTINGVVQTKQVTAPVAVDNTYNAQGVSNVALDMLENSREENTKYGEVDVYDVQSSLNILYSNGFRVVYPSAVGDKYVFAVNNKADLFKYYSHDFTSAEEAADYLHSQGFADGYGGTYANGSDCLIGLNDDHMIVWNISNTTSSLVLYE